MSEKPCQRCHSPATTSPDRSPIKSAKLGKNQKGEKKKKERQGAGECRKGSPSPDTFLSSSLYKVKHCLRFIAVKRKVNHIINKKKKSNYSLWWSNTGYNKSLTWKALTPAGSSVRQGRLSPIALNMKPAAPGWAPAASKAGNVFLLLGREQELQETAQSLAGTS